MEAYRTTFRSRTDIMVVDPSSDFFKYLKTPAGASAQSEAAKKRR